MSIRDIMTIRKAHETLCEFEFEITPLKKGYANRTLRIDLDKNDISILPVSEQMKNLWVGGKGFDLWLMLQEITKDTTWNSNNNPICFATGPLGGTTSFPGSGKTLITSISPTTNSIIDSNVGGYFGPFFKFAGFDALTVVGKAREDVVILIDSTSQKIMIDKAPLESINSHVIAEELTKMYADNEVDMKNIAVVSAGKAADHTLMGILNFSFWDWRRGVARLKQAGRGGIGTVFRDKKIKAVIAKNRDITPSWRLQVNKVAHLTTPQKTPVQTCGSEIKTIQKIILKWNSDPEFIIEMMQDIQDEFRHISKTAIDELCNYTKTPKAYIYHIATFYKSFSLNPKGKTLIQVCLGTACHVKGAMNILQTFERILDIKEGETAGDNKFSLEAVRCLGACSIAPVIKIGDEVIGNVQAKDVEKIIKKYKKKKNVHTTAKDPQPSETDRITKNSLAKIAKREKARSAQYKGMLMVCTGTGCVSAKGFTIRDNLQTLINDKKLHNDFLVVTTGCNGFCAVGPIIVVQPEGIFYQKVTEKDLEEIVDNHLKKGAIVERLLFKDPVTNQICKKITDIEFFRKQELLALRNKGLIDPENIDHYILRNGYKALAKVLKMDPERIIKEIIKSGIRGRGGGGFPTGIKWESCRKAILEKDEISYVVCNADEGDPGAFMDRSIIETDPHSVIEGMLIGARAVCAEKGYIYIRKEYPLALKRLEHALLQARQRGLLGEKILGTDFSFDIELHRGAGAFVCGESTALMASMSGQPGEPRAKYVHNVEFGYREKPTILNNVETWANIPLIIDKGAQWFSGIGAGDVRKNPWNGSSGTKVFSLVGNINNTGLVEVPMGITLREIVYNIGGGIPRGRKFKAVQTGGPSGGCLPESLLDIKVDFDTLIEAGSMMGSGGMIVMDDTTCMVDVAKFFIHFLIEESCGKCTPCREGLFALGNTLTKICNGEGEADDLEFLIETSSTITETSLCQLGATAANPVLSTLKYFREEYEAHIKEKRCPAGVCKPLITYSINDHCTGCMLCAKGCPTGAITGKKKEKHIVNSEKCIKCGICFENCKFNAVEVR